jgi:O-antigen/teichoic acid export membrane protein
VLFAALNQGLYFFALKRQQLRRIALSRLILAVATITVQIVGFLFWGSGALIVGVVVGQGFQLLALVQRLPLPWREWGDWSAIYEVAIRYKRFPQFYLWSGLLSGISLQIPLILLSYFFSAAVTGYYALAYRVLNSPLSLLGQSVGHAYLNASLQQRERISELTRRVYVKQLELVAPFGLLFCVLGPEITTVLFGESWRTAGVMMQWMAPFILLSFISNTFTELFTIYEKQFLSTLFQGFLIAQRFLSIALTAWLSADVMLVIAVFSISSVLMWSGLLFWAMRTTGNPLSVVFIPLRRIGWWIGLCGSMIVIKYFLHPLTIVCAATGGTALLVGYFHALVRSQVPSRQARSGVGYP